jgi:hypothetical protein
MNYSVAGNGRRERSKIMRIGQSAALIPNSSMLHNVEYHYHRIKVKA